MSWTSRLGHNLGRFSPFTRSPPNHGSTTVSDSDFSYITADDLRRHNAAPNAAPEDADLGPSRETDMLVLKNKKNEYIVHFPAYSIAKGELTVGDLRDAAAKKMGSSNSRGIKLLYKGKNMKEDGRMARQEGLKDGSEIMCSVGEVASSSPSSSDDEGDSTVDGPGDASGGAKKKRNRGKKTKRRNKRADISAQESGTSTPDPSKPAAPNSPMEKLNAIHESLMSWARQVQEYKRSPPADPAKKDFEHKRLSESILTQILLKLDGVDSEGDPDARARRKDLVKQTQEVLNELDSTVKQ